MKLMKRNNKQSTDNNFVAELLEKNPDVALAKKIMEEVTGNQGTPMILDQSNYYKIPGILALSERGEGRVGAFE